MTEGTARIEESFTRRHRKENRTVAMLHLSRGKRTHSSSYRDP